MAGKERCSALDARAAAMLPFPLPVPLSLTGTVTEERKARKRSSPRFNGQLSSWWTSIVIGALMLVFIGVQSLLSTMNARQLTARRLGTTASGSPASGQRRAFLRDRRFLVGAAVVVVVLVAAQAIGMQGGTSGSNGAGAACQLKSDRQDHAAELMKGGAVIAYERNGGAGCVDELYAIYPDGRIVADNGTQTVEKKASPAEVDALLTSINDLGWFTDNMYSTSHTPCAQCFSYFTTVAYKGQEKTIHAVDGGTDAPAKYWLMTGKLSSLVPAFNPASS
jgi:hypothetical protein